MHDELGVIWEILPRSTLRDVLIALCRSWAQHLGTHERDPVVRILAKERFRHLAQIDFSLASWVELVLFQEGFELGFNEEVTNLFGEVRKGIPTLSKDLWIGLESVFQRFLLRDYAEEGFWPNFYLAEVLIEKLQRQAPRTWERMWHACGMDLQKLFWLPSVNQKLFWLPTVKVNTQGTKAKSMRQDVINVPVLCGMISQVTEHSGYWWNLEQLQKIRLLRGFAPNWFNEACRMGGLMALAAENR
jgi:hypothetical protein